MTTATEPFTIHPCKTKDDWLAERHKGIGGSEASVIMGVDPYCSPLQLFAERHDGWQKPVTMQMRAGIHLEAGNASWYAEEHKRQVLTPQDYFETEDCFAVIVRSKEYPWMQCTPDRIIVGVNGGPGVLQLKNTGAYTKQEWQEEAPPLRVQAQVQHEMSVLGFDWGAVGAILGGNQRRDFDVTLHPAFIVTLAETERRFMERLKTGFPPSANDLDLEMLKARPSTPGLNCEINVHVLDEYVALGKEMKALEERHDTLKAILMSELGSAETGTVQGIPMLSFRMERKAVMKKAGETQARVFRLLKGAKS